MTSHAPSEALFEQFCQRHHIPCSRVSTSADPTPDFMIGLAGTRVACEVKEIDANAEDLAELEQLRNRGSAGRFLPNRLRATLKHISRQLRDSARAGLPTMLVVYDNTPFKNYSDHSDVITAMFGPVTVSVSVSDGEIGTARVSKPYFGPNRGVGPRYNTSVSAIVILAGGPVPPPDELRVYHNPYAAVELRADVFKGLPATQALLPGAEEVAL